MNVRRDNLPEILLVVVMAVFGLAVIIRLWQDAIVAIGIELLILLIGGLLLQILFCFRHLEEQSVSRERVMWGNLEDFSRHLIQKQDVTAQQVLEAVDSMKSRMYR